jgi:hypothetical protein
MILGSIDAINNECAVGWAFSELFPEGFRVQAFINNDLIGEAVADLYRSDLAEAGLGSGRCGFEIRFTYLIEPDYLPFVDIRPAGSTATFPRTSFAGLNDYFSALHAKFPSVGRHASVLGGLWTDRTDAAAVLKAKVDIGRISYDDSGLISRFIQEGVVVLDLDTARVENPKSLIASSIDSNVGENDSAARFEAVPKSCQPDLLTSISHIFFHDDTLRLLRTFFDDHPIAIVGKVLEENGSEFSQLSIAEDLPSPTECVGLIGPSGEEPIVLEILRGSHRFPEFRADGQSRWTSAIAQRESSQAAAALVPIDLYTISPRSVALVGPGLMHRITPSAVATTCSVLTLPARLGFMRFRNRRPAEELFHHTGARIWLSN